MKKIFVDIPTELLVNDLTIFWNQLVRKVKESYPNSTIHSNYTGEGTIEDSDVIIFLYEFKDYPSYKKDLDKCSELGKMYSYFTKFYSPDFYLYTK